MSCVIDHQLLVLQNRFAVRCPDCKVPLRNQAQVIDLLPDSESDEDSPSQAPNPPIQHTSQPDNRLHSAPPPVVTSTIVAGAVAGGPITSRAATVAPATSSAATVAPATVRAATVAPATVTSATVAPATVRAATVAPATVTSATVAPATVAPAVTGSLIAGPGLIASLSAYHSAVQVAQAKINDSVTGTKTNKPSSLILATLSIYIAEEHIEMVGNWKTVRLEKLKRDKLLGSRPVHLTAEFESMNVMIEFIKTQWLVPEPFFSATTGRLVGNVTLGSNQSMAELPLDPKLPVAFAAIRQAMANTLNVPPREKFLINLYYPRDPQVEKDEGPEEGVETQAANTTDKRSTSLSPATKTAPKRGRKKTIVKKEANVAVKKEPDARHTDMPGFIPIRPDPGTFVIKEEPGAKPAETAPGVRGNLPPLIPTTETSAQAAGTATVRKRAASARKSNKLQNLGPPRKTRRATRADEDDEAGVDDVSTQHGESGDENLEGTTSLGEA
ncbi:hypothetical protein GGR50DRAFT_698496 [Xylaria sp. CBS 124048]|nr:hypothetical protein GGR50DRAFT_698496 [Xylaria sp. CBS 124048]